LAQHLLVLKEFYCRAKLVNEGRPLVDGGSPYTAPEMLSASTLDNQQGLFKLTMKANCEAACAPPYHINPLISCDTHSHSHGTYANSSPSISS
jgi:hypothetical protein